MVTQMLCLEYTISAHQNCKLREEQSDDELLQAQRKKQPSKFLEIDSVMYFQEEERERRVSQSGECVAVSRKAKFEMC